MSTAPPGVSVTLGMSTQVTQGNAEEGRDNVGVGNVNPMMIRERATELAVMDGRTEEEVSQQDLDRAERELKADLTPHAPTGTDPESNAEKLVEQGIEEAVHDEILESNKETVLGNESS